MIERFDIQEKNDNIAWNEFRREAILNYELTQSCISSLNNNNLLIIDAACGLGYGYEYLKCFGRYEGWDISRDSLDICRNRYPNGKFFKVNLEDEFPISNIDVFVSIATLEHVKSPKIVLNNIYEALKPQGKLIVSVPTGMTMDIDPYHLRDWSSVKWENFFVNNGFILKDKKDISFITKWTDVSKMKNTNLKEKLSILYRSTKLGYFPKRVMDWGFKNKFEWTSSWYSLTKNKYG